MPPGRSAWRCILLAALTVSLSGPGTAFGQIPVTLFGYPANPFTNTPPASEWATRDSSPAILSSPAKLDAWGQTQDVATIILPLPVTTAVSTSRFARHNSTGTYLVTQTGGSPAAILRARLRNTSGVAISSITVLYDYHIPVPPITDECPGQRVFYSLTGSPNTWMLLTNLSGVTAAGRLSAELVLGDWRDGGDLFILWLDDNNVTGADGAFAIDNFAVADVIPTIQTPLIITNPPTSLTVNERGSATFTVGLDGAPRRYFWLSNGVHVPGNDRPEFIIPSVAYPDHNGAEISVIVSNSVSFVASESAILTVVPDTARPTVLSVVGELDPTKITVTFSEAMDSSVADDSFVVFPTGSGPSSSSALLTTAVEFTSDKTTVILTTEQRDPSIHYSMQLTQLFDASSQRNAINPDPTIVPLQIVVGLIGFDTNNEWRWNLGNGDLFGTGWESVDYDDSAWPAGPAGLGLDLLTNQVPIRTSLPYVNDGAPAYFRRHFSLPANTHGVTLKLRHVIDDGAVYYINGQEAGRFRVGNGSLSFASRASAAAPEPTPIEGPFNLPATNLVSGDNVIAVSLLQSGSFSSDIMFAADLTATVATTYEAFAPTIVTQPQSQVVREGRGAAFTVVAQGTLPLHYQWSKNGLDLPGATNSAYFIAEVSPPDSGGYRVVITNVYGSVPSQVASLSVIPADPPLFLSAIGHTNLTNITLSFSERMHPENTEVPGHYLIHNPKAPLAILSATLTHGTNVLLITSPRNPNQDYWITLQGVTDHSLAQNRPTPTTRAVLSERLVLAPNDFMAWRFNQANTDLGTAWREVDYDDDQAGWNMGLAGFSSAGEVAPTGFEFRTDTLTSMTNGGPSTIYFRTRFAFPGMTNGARIYAVGVVDDGAVFYINGFEAARLRMTNSSVEFGHPAAAPGMEGTNGHLAEGPIALSTDSIVPFAENLLAVELHQFGVSSDAALSIQLIAILDSTQTGPALRISRDAVSGRVSIFRTREGTLQSATELIPAGTGAGGGTVWSNVPGNPEPHIFTPTTNGSRFFRLGN